MDVIVFGKDSMYSFDGHNFTLLAAAMDEPVTAVTPDTECASCSQVHRFRMHSGRKLLCLMASCNCTGFVAKVEEVEAQSG